MSGQMRTRVKQPRVIRESGEFMHLMLMVKGKPPSEELLLPTQGAN